MSEEGDEIRGIGEIVRSVGLAILLVLVGGSLLMGRGCDDPNSCRCPCHKRQDIEKMAEAIEGMR